MRQGRLTADLRPPGRASGRTDGRRAGQRRQRVVCWEDDSVGRPEGCRRSSRREGGRSEGREDALEVEEAKVLLPLIRGNVDLLYFWRL